eukprot:Gb_22998 [translate_table: standard]
MFGISVIPAILMVLGMAFSPESPRWLFKEGKFAEAETAIQQLWGKGKVEEAMFELRASVGGAMEEDACWFDLLSTRYRKVVSVGAALFLFQQLAGINAVVYYSTSVFRTAGIASDVTASAFVGASNVIVCNLMLRISFMLPALGSISSSELGGLHANCLRYISCIFTNGQERKEELTDYKFYRNGVVMPLLYQSSTAFELSNFDFMFQGTQYTILLLDSLKVPDPSFTQCTESFDLNILDRESPTALPLLVSYASQPPSFHIPWQILPVCGLSGNYVDFYFYARYVQIEPSDQFHHSNNFCLSSIHHLAKSAASFSLQSVPYFSELFNVLKGPGLRYADTKDCIHLSIVLGEEISDNA